MDHLDHPDLKVHQEQPVRLEPLVNKENQDHQEPEDQRVNQVHKEKLVAQEPTVKMDPRENQEASDPLDQLVCQEPQDPWTTWTQGSQRRLWPKRRGRRTWTR